MRNPFLKLAKDPLGHFLIVGIVLFGLLSLLQTAPPEDSDRTIRVDRNALLTFLQYRIGAFEDQKAELVYQAMSPDERQQLIDNFVRNEVLVREAKAMGLSENDAVIRQRLVQRMEFALEGVLVTEDPTQEALEKFLQNNPDLYLVSPSISFSHIFFQNGEVPDSLMALTQEGVLAPSDAIELGDRFPYLKVYAERTVDFIAGHFGDTFAEAVFDSETTTERWVGPISSVHGVHLIYITERQPARLPTLAEIQKRVEMDFLSAERSKALTQIVETLQGDYVIDLAEDLVGEEN